jgi:ABC-2 type transport system permease protein
MRAAWRKVKALSGAHIALWTEYRAELYLWALAGILPLIMLGVWAEVSAQAEFALEPIEFVRYFIAVFLVRQLTVVWVIWEFEELVVHGRLSPLLLQPYDPFWRFLIGHLTERLTRLPFSLGILGLCFALYPSAFWLPDPTSAVLALLALIASFIVRFLIQYAFSMLSFWSERASSIEEAWLLLYMFFSGMLAPLDVYPEPVRRFAELTPFPYLVYFPAQLLMGKPVPLLRATLVLLAWGLGAFILYRFLWKRGLKRYSAMGA